MRIKRASPYTHKESRSIKTAWFIKSERFQRPRGRYFFRYLFQFRPAFHIQFWKFVWSFPAKLQSKKLDYTGTFWGHVWNLGEIFVLVGMLEHTNSQFLWTITFIVTNNTVRSNVDSRRMRILRILQLYINLVLNRQTATRIDRVERSIDSIRRPAHAGSMRSYCRLEIVHV